MKKTLAVLTLAIMVFLTSCSPATPTKEGQPLTPEQVKNTTQNYTKPFSTTAKISYNDMQITANIEKTQSGETKVSFTQPEMLKTLTFQVQNEEIKVGYLGMTFNIDPNNLDSSMLVSTLVSTFNSLGNDKGVSASVKNNQISVVGNTNGAQFEMTFNKENGSAVKLNVPSIGLKAEFN